MKRNDFNSYIQSNDFNGFFIELGWNHVSSSDRINPIVIDETEYEIVPVADKQGFKALICHTVELPQHSLRKKIDFQLRRYFHNYVLIFIKEQSEHQLWMVPIKTVEKRDLVIVEYQSANQADLLFSKVANFGFGMEENVTIVDVTMRVHGAFELNSERVTKDFYAGFKKQHTSFVRFIEGIDVEGDRQWYASVMLNRLMFCYFIQKKGFLNFDVNYLRHKLTWTKEQQGENQFFGTFYKGFLSALFHGGLNEPKHSREFENKYGRIPYLNGGLFDRHQLENDYEDIDIPDQAFEDLFDFFDNWRWHLDTRIEATGKDINPDVLGYIFEQYINDRAQMGAYYTKEDITEYIGKNCILPFLMDEVAKSPSKKHFTPGGYVWETLRNSGDTYIYDAVKKGVEIKEIPEEIAVGLDTSKPGLLERRKEWNRPTPEAYALPTEIWRETIERRNRYNELLNKIRNGEITQINYFITYNLDIRRFVEDLLTKTDDHLFVLHFYKSLQNVSILDPTCGSGAFLFAGLNILEPLYEICIHRMQEFNAGNKALFKEQLEEIDQKYRSNIQYFIYKSIILRNLYGVDIMHEATEIARLRLFLKMVAVVDVDRRADNLGLDPLPDIDFNIRCGNTLIGYATQAELERDLVEGDMFANMEFRDKIEEEMQKVALTYQTFKQIQLSQHDDMESFKRAKAELNQRLAKLNDTLNQKLYKSVENQRRIPYLAWLISHQPFHWLAEFYEIIQGKGGFDVIIGNPPYVEWKRQDLIVIGQNPLVVQSGNLYSAITFRGLQLINRLSSYIGLILPISFISTSQHIGVRKEIEKNATTYYSSYDIRPDHLFDGAAQRLTIFINSPKKLKNNSYTDKQLRWYTIFRPFLFDTINYNPSTETEFCFFRTCVVSNTIISKIFTRSTFVSPMVGSTYWVATTANNFIKALKEQPNYISNGLPKKPSGWRELGYSSEHILTVIAIINSSTFYYLWKSSSDGFNLTAKFINFFLTKMVDKEISKTLQPLTKKLLYSLELNSETHTRNQKTTGKTDIQLFRVKPVKPIIDEIDKVLAKHYGFTEEELDFIINYDIKYRMGSELNPEEE